MKKTVIKVLAGVAALALFGLVGKIEADALEKVHELKAKAKKLKESQGE